MMPHRILWVSAPVSLALSSFWPRSGQMIPGLLQLREHDVTVQVMPFTAGAHAALCDQFEIIQWPLERS